MPKQTVEAMVDGGKASAGPPLGPALGPLKVNIGEVIAAINEKTKDMAGMKVPVKVTVDTETKKFEIETGSPPASSLIKKELKLEKGSGEAGTGRIGNLTKEQAKKIARIKFGTDDDAAVRQIEGTGRSMGVTVGKGEVSEAEKKEAADAAKAHAEEAKAAEDKKASAESGAPAEDKPESEEKPEAKSDKPKEKKE